MTRTTDEAELLRRQLDDERRARVDAERVAEENARALYARQDELELLEAVAAASNEAEAAEPALGVAIVHVCAYLRAPVGHAWLADTASSALRPAGVWYLEDERRFAALRAASEDPAAAAPEGLPARVMASGEPEWLTDLAGERRTAGQRVAAAAGLRGAFALPVLSGTRALGVLEFFTEQAVEPDPVLHGTMSQIGVQLGRVVERVRARDELERSNAELAAFAEVASHDLFEPLRSVAGFVGLLQRHHGSVLDDEARDFVAQAADGVRRMQARIDELLVYARAGADLRPAPVDLAALVAATLVDLEPLATERRAEVEVAELPVVRADPAQLQRVLQNLLANAMKFTAAGVTPRIRVASRPVMGAWEVSVADNGIGLDPAQADRAFEMRTRMGGRSFAGSGLGLAISRRIVERHGGRLWVEPRAGGGSVFRLTLPR